MIIDVHSHVKNDHEITVSLRKARRHGIILCINVLNAFNNFPPTLPTPEYISACNDLTFKVASGNTDCVIPMWYLNPYHPETMQSELLRRVKAWDGHQGVKLWTGVKANDPRVDGILHLCAEYKLPVLQHTYMAVTGNMPGETNPFDMREAGQRHPDVNFFFGHSGSDMEYGAKAAQGMPNLFMDVGGGDATNGYTETLVEHAGADHVVYGSDLNAPRSFMSQLAKVYGAAITEEEKELIFWRNAHAIFSRQTVAWSQFERHEEAVGH